MDSKDKQAKTQETKTVKRPGKTEADYKAEAFVKEYTSNGYNGSKAYRIVANKPDMDTTVASSSANRLLKKEKVQALLRGTAERAKGKLDQLIQDDYHKDQFNAMKLALAYEYGTPVSRSENVNVNVTVEDILKTT